MYNFFLRGYKQMSTMFFCKMVVYHCLYVKKLQLRLLYNKKIISNTYQDLFKSECEYKEGRVYNCFWEGANKYQQDFSAK